MTTVRVDLGDRTYDITVGVGLLQSADAADRLLALAGGGGICIVTHPGLRAAYAQPLATSLSARGATPTLVTIPSGERAKRLKTVERLYGDLLDARMGRQGLLIAVGGGVLGDLAGFAAATYMRGIRFVQVPTTLLAQVDASVGGKTGVDLPQGKNLVGAFHQPVAVLIDPLSLRTLPARELRAGLAEVLKYGIIYDAAFFDETVANLPGLLRRDMRALTRVITRSCEIKADVVSQDETEQGLRAILNFGHTIGHALEAVTGYRRYKHGEAVAVGMVSAALIGEEVSVTPCALTARLIDALRTARLPVAFPTDVDLDQVIEAARRDKKAHRGRLRFVLARGAGEVLLSDSVTSAAIYTALARQQRMPDA